DERRAYLEGVRADPEILVEVTSMLEEAVEDAAPPQSKAGTRFGRYEIVEMLGQGGMGQVYSARDTELDRLVAVKFLSPEMASSRLAVERLVREAKAASALNHPSIVHIYDIGQWEGADFIAMEYVEGRTVQQILREGPMPVDDALRFSIQVADAMSVAHAANIVHRDLKPANVMITARGLVKILDFGVAKLNDPAAPPHAAEQWSPSAETQTYVDVNQTVEGMVIGSPAYMSPEQATGKQVDARSDIFEFGVLLHEMLTGQTAFSGGTKLEVLSAILRTEPPRPSSINPAVTPELEWVIARCLRKDRERRFQSMSEVKVALEDLRTETTVTGFRSGTIPTQATGTTSTAAAGVPPHRFRMWGIAIFLGLALTTLGALMLLRPWRASSASNAVPEINRITTESGLSVTPAISPDGKLLAYASDRSGDGNFDIWLRQIGGGDAVRLTKNPADDLEPSFSPDGTRIVFRSTRAGGGLYIIPTLGGEERRIADGGRQPQFSPDGSKVAYWTGPADPLPLRNGIAHAFIIDLATSSVRRLRPDFAASAHPVWSPDGTHLGFLGLKDARDMDSFNWWVTPANGASAAIKCPIMGDYFSVEPFAWRGDRLYFNKNDGDRVTIGDVGIDPKKWTPIGDLRPRTAGTTNEYSPSVSKDGKLVFASVTENMHLYSLPLDANRGVSRGAADRLTEDAGINTARSISRDGQRVAFTSSRNGAAQVWVKDLATGASRSLTTGTEKTAPVISPDGSFVAWTENIVGKNQIFVTPFEGGVAREICNDCGTPVTPTPDGRYLTYRTSPMSSVGLLEVSSGKKTDYLKKAPLVFGENSISPDGKWIVFAAHRDTRNFTVYLAPFSVAQPPAQSQWIEIARSPETDPNAGWSPDGNLLYFSSERDGYTCLWALRLDPQTKHPKGQLFAVRHFHAPSQTMAAPSFHFPPALALGKIVVSLAERSGGIWILQLPD
ncbi:MAG TPA: protein kinase, partial [Bryobacteraceae bacterium]|nr:protein kinase [Bryobacteraceae bacterium]